MDIMHAFHKSGFSIYFCRNACQSGRGSCSGNPCACSWIARMHAAPMSEYTCAEGSGWNDQADLEKAGKRSRKRRRKRPERSSRCARCWCRATSGLASAFEKCRLPPNSRFPVFRSTLLWSVWPTRAFSRSVPPAGLWCKDFRPRISMTPSNCVACWKAPRRGLWPSDLNTPAS